MEDVESRLGRIEGELKKLAQERGKPGRQGQGEAREPEAEEEGSQEPLKLGEEEIAPAPPRRYEDLSAEEKLALGFQTSTRRVGVVYGGPAFEDKSPEEKMALGYQHNKNVRE